MKTQRLARPWQPIVQKYRLDYWWAPIETGVVTKLEKSDWPGIRWYRVDIDGGEKNKFVCESDMAPLRKFNDGEHVTVRDGNCWMDGVIIKLVNRESDYMCYRQHWYKVKTNGLIPTSAIHNSIFNGIIREKDILSLTN